MNEIKYKKLLKKYRIIIENAIIYLEDIVNLDQQEIQEELGITNEEYHKFTKEEN